MNLEKQEQILDSVYKEPIGIFDSGVGGLTVLTEIRKVLPHENLIYLGDSARSPYGSKSAEKIKSMSLENSLFLVNSGAKVLVIACNTATAIARNYVQSMLGKKVIGVIDAGVRTALATSKNKKIGIIGTNQTIYSKAYETALKELNPSVEIFAKPTPIFATIVEEGFIENESTTLLIQEELDYFKECGVDTLILGCTHYPFLTEKINNFFEGKVALVNPARETALELYAYLQLSETKNSTSNKSVTTFYTSDTTEIFERNSRKLLSDFSFSVYAVAIDSFEKQRIEHEKFMQTGVEVSMEKYTK